MTLLANALDRLNTLVVSDDTPIESARRAADSLIRYCLNPDPDEAEKLAVTAARALADRAETPPSGRPDPRANDHASDAAIPPKSKRPEQNDPQARRSEDDPSSKEDDRGVEGAAAEAVAQGSEKSEAPRTSDHAVMGSTGAADRSPPKMNSRPEPAAPSPPPSITPRGSEPPP